MIVGGGPGLGMNVARRFARGGFDIALVSRNSEKLSGLSETLISEGFTASGFTADAGIEEQLVLAFERVIKWNANIGVLIYNAAAMVADDVIDVTPRSMMENMAINLGGAICSVNQVLPSMREKGSGTVLITGGGLGIEPYPNWASLSVGKAALRSYSIALHKELTPEEIHVAVVAVCGIVEPGGLFEPDQIAEEYWKLHSETKSSWRRELIYLPQHADPFYNDLNGTYRSTSMPIRA